MKRSLDLAIAAATLHADDAAPARFFIERIEVRNAHRVSPELVISESLLRAGAEYSEDELRAASLRLNRLAYLLSADFALEKGSDRGRHVLVITVAETKPFFYLIDARQIFPADNNDPHRTAVDYASSLGPESTDAAIGYRKFIGRRGVAHVGLTSREDRQEFTTDYSALAAGYTQYDLFGTHAFATLNLRWPVTQGNPALSPQLVVGIPLTPKHTLTLDYEETRFRRNTTILAGAPFTRQDAERVVSLIWAYNTTNQPFVPTRGTLVRIVPQWSTRDLASYSRAIFFPGNGERVDAYADHFNGYGIDATAARYFELAGGDSVSATLQGGWSSTEERANQLLTPRIIHAQPAYASVGGGYSYNLRRDASKDDGDSRVEVDAQYVARQGDYSRNGSQFIDIRSDEGLRLSAAWVRRNVWGTVRLGVGYTWR